MWHFGTWVKGGLGSVGGLVGLDELKGVFQPKLFYNSVFAVRSHRNNY